MRRWILGTTHHKLVLSPFVLSSVRHTTTKARGEVHSPMWANAKRLIITGSVLVGNYAESLFVKINFVCKRCVPCAKGFGLMNAAYQKKQQVEGASSVISEQKNYQGLGFFCQQSIPLHHMLIW